MLDVSLNHTSVHFDDKHVQLDRATHEHGSAEVSVNQNMHHSHGNVTNLGRELRQLVGASKDSGLAPN